MHLKLRIQYDGTDFAGSQLQPEARGRTVQGELERALARIAGYDVRVALAGRTDTGVHAWGQVASFSLENQLRLSTPQAVQNALNGVLSTDVAVSHAEEVPPEFHARFSAKRRAYRYLIWNGRYPLPLMARYSLQVRQLLDQAAMSDALSHLTGTHDLAAFAGSGMGVSRESVEEKPSTVRTISLARLVSLPPGAQPWSWSAPKPEGEWHDRERLLAVDLVANAFLPQMIRTIVGTLLEVGTGKRTVSDMKEIIQSRDRRNAGPTAKPHGLCLLWVEY